MDHIVMREYTDIRMEEILPLYESVQWTSYTAKPDMLRAAFENSLKAVAAYDQGKLIGIIRAVGDGHSILYVQDLLVYPEYQRRGIGRALLSKIDSLYPHVYQKVLMTDDQPKTLAFYESCGFTLGSKCGIACFVKIRG